MQGPAPSPRDPCPERCYFKGWALQSQQSCPGIGNTLFNRSPWSFTIQTNMGLRITSPIAEEWVQRMTETQPSSYCLSSTQGFLPVFLHFTSLIHLEGNLIWAPFVFSILSPLLDLRGKHGFNVTWSSSGSQSPGRGGSEDAGVGERSEISGSECLRSLWNMNLKSTNLGTEVLSGYSHAV